MSDALRRVYNQIDRLFDFRAIAEGSRSSRDGGETRRPVTAAQAFGQIRPFAYALDRQARLKMILSQQGVQLDGTSAHWEFFFDLTRRRAKLVCEWILPWDEAADGYKPARIDMAVNPFPPIDSPIRQAVREGKLLHRQMVGMWARECSRLPDIPRKFRDTDIAVEDFLRQGLVIDQAEFSISTGESPPGHLCWIVQSRDATYHAALLTTTL